MCTQAMHAVRRRRTSRLYAVTSPERVLFDTIEM
uniref:Uncharacterized protein n=1 Tax=Arundo donax TaxID=35708 RepID=A0A0A9BVR0_ARUDO